MHHHISFFKSLLVAAFVFVFFSSFTDKRKNHLVMINPLNITRNDELIVLTRNFAEKHFGKIDKDMYLTVKESANKTIIVQFDDLNSDGVWDEFAFLYSFVANEKVELTIEKTTTKPQYDFKDIKAHVRQKHKNADNSFGASVLTDTMPYNNQPTDFSKQKLPPYLTEGPAWENDKVGFRKYFDTRNANDLWGKQTSKMVLDFVGVNPDSIYHNLSWWGMDILKVGKSLGAGAIALQMKLKDGKDSLVRLGSNTKQIVYHQIADGPVRAIFTIEYKGWKINNDFASVNVTEQISIWGGQYFFLNKVIVENTPPESRIVTGIPDFFKAYQEQYLANGQEVLLTHGNQSENKDALGIAIMTSENDFVEFNAAPFAKSDILNTYTVSKKISVNQPFEYRFYSAWSLTDKRFFNSKSFHDFMMEETAKSKNSIIIK